MDQRLIAAQCLSVAARRFAQLYSQSETDEGHSWGEGGQPQKHADAVLAAIELFQVAMGDELGALVLAGEAEAENRRLRGYLERIETTEHQPASMLATAALAPVHIRKQMGLE